jgi:hypothetical protein
MRKLVVLIAVLAMFASACGGGGDDNVDGESGSDGDGDGETLSADEWCGFNEGVEDLNLFGASADFNGLESSIQGFLDVVDEVEDRAPEEIKDDIAVMGEAMAEFDEVLSEVDYDFLALSEADLAALDIPEVEQASENISRYADENCGGDASDPADDSVDEAPEVEETPEPQEDADADDIRDVDLEARLSGLEVALMGTAELVDDNTVRMIFDDGSVEGTDPIKACAVGTSLLDEGMVLIVEYPDGEKNCE